MKTHLASILAIALLLTEPARSAEKKTGAFELKNRSAFKSATIKRDPFWPIGWVKPDVTSNPSASSTTEFRRENFKLTSVMLGDPPLAVINGKEFAEGEVGPVKVGLDKIEVTVLNIMDGAVRLQHRGQIIVVELKRR